MNETEKLQTNVTPEDEDSDETQKDEVTKLTNPIKFLSNFRSSSYYKKAYDDFIKGKTFDSDVTNEEKLETFESVEAARQSLMEYAENTNSILKFSPSEYTKDFCKNFYEYKKHMEEIREQNFTSDRDAIIALDQVRSNLHMEAALELVRQSLTKSTKLARGLVEIMIIEKGLENFSNARVSENERLRSQLMYNPENY